MIKLFYCSINKMLDEEISKYLERIPEFMRSEVLRYRFPSDQKSRLLARLMLYKSLKEDGKGDLIHEWKRDSFQKPLIDRWNPFSISHSGEFVLFCYGKNEVGVDIEKVARIDFELLNYLHAEEQRFVMSSRNPQRTFFTIWSKKEAFLKAIGRGISQDLKEYSCVQPEIYFAGSVWYFCEINVNHGYVSFICSKDKVNNPALVEFSLQ